MKKIIFTFMVFALFTCAGCTFPHFTNPSEGRPNTSVAAEIQARLSFEKLVEAINEKDKDKMKSLMSEHMLSEGLNIEEGIDYILEFVEEPLIFDWTKFSPCFEEKNNGGKKTMTVWGGIPLSTASGNEYSILFSYVARDDEAPCREGIKKIEIFRDRCEYIAYNYDGIYVPDDYLKAWKEKQAAGEGTEMETGETESTPENVSETDAQDESSLR